jgi:DNA-binding NarL/FixJ family response regulator
MANTTIESAPSPEEVTWPVRTIACIDVDLSGVADGDAGGLLGSTLQMVQGAVRAEDRICPMSATRVAVEFGPVANGVPAHVLGFRLAQAIGRDLPAGTPAACLSVSVGMAGPAEDPDPASVSRRAIAAATAGTEHLTRRPFSGTHVSNALVTVDQSLESRPTGAVFCPMHRRDVHRYRVGHRPSAVPRLAPPVLLADAGGLDGTGVGADMTVLVVDAAGDRLDDPGFATITAASMAERLGCRSAAVTAVIDEIPLAIDGYALDLVVLVLEGGRSGRTSTWGSGAWGVPASLTASYRAADVPVLAVSAGAGAGAVASCVAQGALALFSLEHLPNALVSLARYEGEDLVPGVETPFPPRFRALVGLTASERRILYYLTEGWSAQDIADRLVVSLTTVRSHIRSTLRKLGVRSQLAAVAIANSRDLEDALSGDAS